jgi:hypothetical protein
MKYRFLFAAVFFAQGDPVLAANAKPVPLQSRVKTAIQGGIKYLRNKQMKDGSWEVDTLSSTFSGGWTSLALLALLNAGVSPKDKMIQGGLVWLRKLNPRYTYVRSLQTAVFVKAGEARDKKRIQKNINWLLKNRCRSDGKLLGWTYTESSKSSPDNSNTQYAVLALHAGRLAGANVPKAIWKDIQDFYLRTQIVNGGWPYNAANKNLSYLTMDIAGLCS